MNLPLMLVLLSAFVFAVGILLGQGLNGRSQIERDKRRAAAQRDLNERRRVLRMVSELDSQDESDQFEPLAGSRM